MSAKHLTKTQVTVQKTCKACGEIADNGKFCRQCGQVVDIKRITAGSIVHEIFHFFTHLDKGFAFTLKKLLREPGKMQREYVSGVRIKHQKPFSMFLISATTIALVLYWLNIVLAKYYSAGDMKEALFFDKYMLLLLMAMVPLSATITYLVFYNSVITMPRLLYSLYTISP